MPAGAALLYYYDRGAAAPSDTAPPTVEITALPSKTRISRVAGQDVTTFSFTVSEDYQAYQIKAVPADTSPQTAGTLIEAGTGGTASTPRAADITDDELVAASLTGAMIIKVFAQDTAGNWST